MSVLHLQATQKTVVDIIYISLTIDNLIPWNIPGGQGRRLNVTEGSAQKHSRTKFTGAKGKKTNIFFRERLSGLEFEFTGSGCANPVLIPREFRSRRTLTPGPRKRNFKMDCDEETIDHEGTGKAELKQNDQEKKSKDEENDQKEKDKEEVDQEEKGMEEEGMKDEDDQEKKSKDEEDDQKEKDKEEVDQEEKGMEEEENVLEEKGMKEEDDQEKKSKDEEDDQKEKDKEEVDQEEKGMEEEENFLEEKGMKEEDDQEKKSKDEEDDQKEKDKEEVDQEEKGMEEEENFLRRKDMKEEDDQEKRSKDEEDDQKEEDREEVDQEEKGMEEEENFLGEKDMKGELDRDDKEKVDQEEKGLEGKKGDQKEKSKDEKENAQEQDGNKSKANEVPDEPPKTKKAALERLRNMHFAAKDPFKDKPLRDTAKYSLLSRTVRDRTPPPTLQRKNAEDERRRDRTRDESATKALSSASGRRRRSRSRPSRYRTDETNASASLIESRHMRGTMFFLQAEQKAAASSLSAQRSRIAQAGAKPLRERIDALLARPDHEVLTMNATEIRALILSGVELFRDQEHFLSGRKAQLIELDTMISQEKEAIEKISKELPNQFRPPPVDEILVQQQQRAAPLQQQQDQHIHQQFNGPLAAHNKQHHFVPPPFLSHQQKQLDFTVPPPSLNMQQPNEFSTPTLPPFANQFLRPPPSLPKPLPQSSAKMTQFGHSPSLLFTKPPPTSISSDDFSKCISTVPIHNPIVSSNANFAKADSQGGPTPNQQQLSAAKHAAPISLASIPHMSRPPSFGTGHHLPPTANNRPEQQQQHQSLLSQSKTPTSIPQLMVSNALKGIHSVSSTSATQSHSTPSFMTHNVQQQHVVGQQQQQQQNFQQPPPLSYTHSHQQQKQPPQASQSMLSMKSGNVVVVVPQQSQQHHYQQRTLTPLKHTSASSTSIASSSPNQQGASTPSQQAPRPLMSLSIGPPQPQQTKQHSRQSSSSIGHGSGTLGGRQQQQLQFANDGSADGSAARGGKSIRGRLKMVRGAGTRKQHTGKSSDRRPVGGMGLATKEQHHAPRRRRYSSPSPSPWPAAANASRPLESSSSGSVKRLKIEEDFEESSEAQEAEQFSSSSVTRPLSSFTTEPPVTVQAADTTTGGTTDNALVVDEYAALPVSP
uniref:Uncharacterized protein n=1 Tax=Globodera rostochiensis TaxID=31243 RepID=A0A914HFZ1_GLORO